MGSEIALAPLGMVKLDRPPEKVRGARELGDMAEVPAEPLSGTAMVAAVMGRSDTPKALEMTSWIVGADWVMKTVCRMVAFWKTTPVAVYEKPVRSQSDAPFQTKHSCVRCPL